MRTFIFSPLFFLLSLVLPIHITYAEETPLPANSSFLLSSQNNLKEMWSITGLLHNEHNEPYGFSFNLERQGASYHVFSTIVDLNQHKNIWHQEESGYIPSGSQPLEKIGHFFWRYSDVNSSLIIGFDDKHLQVFNLKFDLLEPNIVTKTAKLTPNLKLQQFWSGQISGHININHEEQFVSSHEMWLQQIWQNENEPNPKLFQEMICKFHDGSALFALQIPEKNAFKANLAGLYNQQGDKLPISQFLQITPPNSPEFDIVLNQPNSHLHLKSIYEDSHYQVYFGQLDKEQTHGFCMYQKNPWEVFWLENAIPPIPFEPPHENILEKTLALGKKNFRIPSNLKNKLSS